MQKNPSFMTRRKEAQEHARRDAFLRKLRSIFLDNWGTKLLALLLAVGLWAGLITQDPTLTREKQFTNVAVTVIGADTLKRNGYIILEDLDEVLGSVALRVSVPQGHYNVAQAANYAVRVDLSRIHEAGTQTVRISSTNSATYGTVTELSPAAVQVTVDEYITRYRIPVTVVTQGEAPDGFYAAAPSTDPPMIAVSGPKSVVDRIVSAQVTVDQSTLPAREGDVRRALAFTLVDESGEPIRSDLLEVTSESVLLDSIIVDQNVYSKRTVEFSDLGLVTGEPAEGYEIKGVYITPASVTIAGRSAAIGSINLVYADSTVNVKGMTESISRSLRLRQPSSIKYASTDTVNVAVEIGPVITSRAYEAQVALQGLSGTLAAEGAHPVTVHLTGAQPWLDSLSAADILLTCDLSSITTAGVYTLPVNCQIKGAESQQYTCELSQNILSLTVNNR